jgi:cobaltochelatase CobS
MGFGKGNMRMPSSIENLDFSRLHNWQFRTLADWMNCRSQVSSGDRDKVGNAALKEVCLQNVARAQIGYEVIVLRQAPKSAEKALDKDVEVKLIDLVSDLMTAHKGSLDSAASAALDKHVELASSKISKMLKAAIAEAAEKARPIVVKSAGKTRQVEGVMPAEFERIMHLASARIPVMLVGPAGCGKTFIAEKIAEQLDLTYADQSCSEGMSESVFNGRLLPIGKNGAFEHVASPWMIQYEKGGVMLLDELDAADSNLTTYMNKAIANKSYTVDQRYLNPVVKKHKNFVLIACANTFGHGADAMYVGRNQLDAATLDRFKVGLVCMDYSREVELSLAPPELCEWAWRIRTRIREQKLRRIMSTRVIKDLATMVDMYQWSEKDWNEAYFTGWSDEDRRAVS